MSEFRIHHDVNELLSLLRVRGGDGAEVYIDLLQKNRTPYVTTTVSAHSAKVSARPGAALFTEYTPLMGRRRRAGVLLRSVLARGAHSSSGASPRADWCGELRRDGRQPHRGPHSSPPCSVAGGRAETRLVL